MNYKLLHIASAIFVAVTLAGCDEPPPESPASPEQAGGIALAPGEYTFVTADGNEMPYTVAGTGDVTVLLVHCWMCDRTFWSEQMPVLGQQYRAIAVDLPGHGKATTARTNWTVSGFGDDVAGLVDELDLSNVVLVGHSMGGPVSLRAAALAGDAVRGIVAVDTLHDAEFEFSDEQMEAFMAAFEADFTGTCRDFVQQMFPEEGVDAIRTRVQEQSCSEDRAEAGVALMQDFGRIDMPRWFSEAGVPIRAVNAAAPNPTQVETNRKYADFEVELIDDVGHYLQMTRPEKFNPLLLDAIEDILGDGAGN
jgi:pimeloyl-ACP methyl ester carboxylesterase